MTKTLEYEASRHAAVAVGDPVEAGETGETGRSQ